MDDRVKNFINSNLDLINENTKESWEQIYSEVRHEYIGRFTQVLLEAGIDPTEVLGYIPQMYLSDATIKEYIIPNNVTSIGSDSFSGCRNLTSIVIGDSVVSIGSYAFAWCYDLTSIVIPNNVKNIGYDAFHGCTSLKRVIIPNSVTTIGDEVFKNCINLKEIEYLGTKKEALDSLRTGWILNSSIQKIICTDGVIEL